jgi:uncharacterized membrane protein YjjB (DUF3815 family)
VWCVQSIFVVDTVEVVVAVVAAAIAPMVPSSLSSDVCMASYADSVVSESACALYHPLNQTIVDIHSFIHLSIYPRPH